MAKSTSAIIKLTLRTNKTLSNGMHPIMLTIQFNGRKEKSTGYSCAITDWDNKQECIKNKKFPNVSAINKAISEFKQKLISKKLDYEINGQKYTAEMLLENENRNFSAKGLIFSEMVEEYIKLKKLKPNTVHTYDVALANLKGFTQNKELLITEITVDFCENFAIWLKEKGLNGKENKDGTIRTIFSKIAAIFNHYIEHGIINANIYPFRKFKYGQKYKKSNKKQAITTQNMLAIHSYYFDLVFEEHDLKPEEAHLPLSYGKIGFRKGALSKLQDRSSIEHTCALFLFGWIAQGLAMADIAKIKLVDISQKKIEDEDGIRDVYIIDTDRSKTGRGVSIVINRDDISQSILQPFINTAPHRDDYLFPIFQNNDFSYSYTNKKHFDTALQTTARLTNRNLKVIVTEVNKRTKAFCKKNKIKVIPDAIPTTITFYAMRHTFATSMIQKGINPTDLATMMGRSPSGIFGYVKELTKVEDISNLKKKLY